MKTQILRPTMLACIGALALSFAAVPAQAHNRVYVGIAPPGLIFEPPLPLPGPGYVWQPGYWAWNGIRYAWIPGVYVLAPYPGAVSRRLGLVWRSLAALLR